MSRSNGTLTGLFARLTLAASSSDYGQVLKLSDDILSASPNDVRAAKQKLIALIKLDKYHEALTFLEKCACLGGQDTLLERSFCLYKLGKGAEVQKLLESASGPVAAHIRAQNAYRMEDFETAIRCYSDMLKLPGQSDRDEIVANLAAAKAQITAIAGTTDVSTMTVNSYEVQFNVACELVALGRFSEAEAALSRAESNLPLGLFLRTELCTQSGLSSDELKVEQGTILTQLAYVRQLKGSDPEGVSHLYSEILQQNVDAATKAIAVNNRLVLEPPSNPFESHRIHSIAHETISSSNPFSAQSRLFSFNSLLLSSQVHKNITKGIKRHKEAYHLDYSPSLLRLHKDLPTPPDPSFLNRLTSLYCRDEKDVGVALFLVQYHLEKGNTQLAISTLERLFHALKDDPAIKYAPGLVSLAVVLLPKIGKEEKANGFLQEAKRFWDGRGKNDTGVAELRNNATLARLTNLVSQPLTHRSEELDSLIREHELYLQAHPNDVSTHAILAALYSLGDDPKVANHTSFLPSVASLVLPLDIETLENQGIPSTQPAPATKPPRATKPRKRRIRGNKVFDPSQPVDPERWLPLRERSYYKPVKGRKKKVGGATQGGSVSLEQESMIMTGGGAIEIKKTEGGMKKKKKGRR